ncbi:hypothetical protein G9A89_000732 [Geosiphon pyriformis]|nr:hypothetical protein G9A89_000732 [Geosiphon pyriformis]
MATKSKFKTPFKTEYAVQMTCGECVESIRNALSSIPEIDRFEIELGEQRVLVEGKAPPSKVSKILKNTGRIVIVRGQGNIRESHSGAAVCIFEAYTYSQGNVKSSVPACEPKGLARFIQIDDENCLIDVTVEGISPGRHGIHIHELGNLSKGFESTGSHYNPDNSLHGNIESGHAGDLGNIEVDEKGWGDLVVESTRLKVWDLIGRAMVISQCEDDLGNGKDPQSKIDGNSGPGLIAGVIARSAGAFENAKKICTCSGRTLWEEARF